MAQSYLTCSMETKIRVKFGKSIHPAQRVKQLQTGNHDKISILAVSDITEAYLHHRYAKYRIHGEWFEVPMEIYEEIRVLMNFYSNSDRLGKDLDDIIDIDNIELYSSPAVEQPTVTNKSKLEGDETTPVKTLSTFVEKRTNIVKSKCNGILYPCLFEIEYYKKYLFVIIGPNELNSLIIKLSSSGEPVGVNWYADRNKTLKIKTKVILKQYGLLLENDESINCELFTNRDDLKAKLKALINGHVPPPTKKPEPKYDYICSAGARITYRGTAEVSNDLRPENVMDLRVEFLRILPKKIIQEVCKIPSGYTSIQTREIVFRNPKEFEKLNTTMIEHLISRNPKAVVLKNHPNLLNSASNFRAAIVDYFHPIWVDVIEKVKGPGCYDLELFANNIAPHFLMIDLRELAKTLRLNVSVDSDRSDKLIENYNKPLIMALLETEPGYMIIMGELSIIITSFLGLTPQMLFDLTGMENLSHAVENLVIYHGCEVMQVMNKSLHRDDLLGRKNLIEICLEYQRSD